MMSGRRRRRRGVFLLVSQRFLLLIVLCVTSRCCKAQQNNDQNCTSSCGNIHDIHYPFRLEDDPQHCGLPDYQLACNNNRTILYLKADPYAGYDYKFNYSYYVEAITYDNFSIRLVDPGLDKDNCSSLPLHSLPYTDYFGFSTAGPCFGVMFTSCQNPVNRSGYVDASFCDKRNTTSTSNTTSPSPLQNHNYVVREGMDISELEDSCSIGNLVWTTANILGPATEGNIFFQTYMTGLHMGLSFYGIASIVDSVKQEAAFAFSDLRAMLSIAQGTEPEPTPELESEIY
ncbi:unnamed protein product [Ilex paraguariensis]|uniref:Wall-associated receptor kinase galacturonan-binding domain-containing protein n=1 Tax=Ilex paraguariensis TaxID=185542 RepID=A0ABC8RX36_9AQUA